MAVAAVVAIGPVVAVIGTPGVRATCASTRPAPISLSPVEHVVFIVKENHAFENYFGELPGVVGYPPTGSVPLAYGSSARVSPFPILGSSTPDLPHDEQADLADYNGGLNDGFVAQATAAGWPSEPTAAMGYYSPRQVGVYYEFARSSLVDDHFFTGILGPTLPNRLFDIAASAGNVTSDLPPPNEALPIPTILDQLNGAGIPWAYDYSGSTEGLAPNFFPSLASAPCPAGGLFPTSALGEQLNSSHPPSVVFVDPSNNPIISEHPPGNVTLGAAWTASIIATIYASRVASSTAVFLFFDENGGYWDPVPPPRIDGSLDGFRVPFIVLSPWTPRGVISHQTLDPGNLLRYVDDNWGLPLLNQRVAESAPPDGFFDFSKAPHSVLSAAARAQGPHSAAQPPSKVPAASEPTVASERATLSGPILAPLREPDVRERRRGTTRSHRLDPNEPARAAERPRHREPG